jgi:hypothetical protein
LHYITNDRRETASTTIVRLDSALWAASPAAFVVTVGAAVEADVEPVTCGACVEPVGVSHPSAAVTVAESSRTWETVQSFRPWASWANPTWRGSYWNTVYTFRRKGIPSEKKGVAELSAVICDRHIELLYMPVGSIVDIRWIGFTETSRPAMVMVTAVDELHGTR